MKICFFLIILIHLALSLRLKRYRTKFYPRYRIIQGWMTTIWKYPFMVSLQHSFTIARNWCGGTILTEKWILTAGHCIVDRQTGKMLHPRELIVVAGFTNIRRLSRIEYIYEIKGLVCHPLYNRTVLYNDIGLIKIKQKFNLNHPRKILRTVNLIDPKIFQGRSLEEIFQNCLAVGWGSSSHKGRFSDILKEIDLPLLSFWKCSRMLGGSPFLRPTNVCTYDSKHLADTCQGDSGGPLICEGPNGSLQIGITSWGQGCGKRNAPRIWTRVDKYKAWIQAVIMEELHVSSTAQRIKPKYIFLLTILMLFYDLERMYSWL